MTTTTAETTTAETTTTAEGTPPVPTPEASAPVNADSFADRAFDTATAWVVRGLKASRVALRRAALALTRVSERAGRLATDLDTPRADQRSPTSS